MKRYIAFKTIVEEGSFTGAAEKLGYSQPALSHMISSLEEELNLNLLERSRKGARLSQDGEIMYPYIVHLIENYHSMLSRAQNLYRLENSIIHISSFASLSSDWLPEKIGKFKTMYPNLDFSIRVGDHYRNKQDILSGLSEIGILYESSSSDMEHEKLGSFPDLVLMPVGHRLAEKSTVSIDDLANEPFVISESSEFNEILDALHDNRVYPKIISRINDYQSIVSLVREGLCTSILPDIVLRHCGDGIVTRPLEPPVYRTLYISCKTRDHLSHAALLFLDYLLEESIKDGYNAL